MRECVPSSWFLEQGGGGRGPGLLMPAQEGAATPFRNVSYTASTVCHKSLSISIQCIQPLIAFFFFFPKELLSEKPPGQSSEGERLIFTHELCCKDSLAVQRGGADLEGVWGQRWR